MLSGTLTQQSDVNGIVSFDDLIAMRPELSDISEGIRTQIKIDALYEQYVERQARAIENLKKDEAIRIPSNLDFREVTGLSNELREKLVRVQPETLGQAGRVEGMTPAALTLILAKVRKLKKTSA